MSIKTILLYFLKDFINNENQFDMLLKNQDEILEKVTVLENKNEEIKQLNYLNFLTLKNFIIFLIVFLTFGVTFYMYNSYMLDLNIINSCMKELNLNTKDLATMIKAVHQIDQENLTKLLEQIHKLVNERSLDQQQILFKILNILQKQVIKDHKDALNIPIDFESMKDSEFKWND